MPRPILRTMTAWGVVLECPAPAESRRSHWSAESGWVSPSPECDDAATNRPFWFDPDQWRYDSNRVRSSCFLHALKNFKNQGEVGYRDQAPEASVPKNARSRMPQCRCDKVRPSRKKEEHALASAAASVRPLLQSYPVHLKHRLRNVQSNCRNLPHGSPPLSAADTPCGGGGEPSTASKAVEDLMCSVRSGRCE